MTWWETKSITEKAFTHTHTHTNNAHTKARCECVYLRGGKNLKLRKWIAIPWLTGHLMINRDL